MRIIFCGDSLTEGSLGVSYVAQLQERFPEHEMLNYGLGGDTVRSLYRRMQALPAGACYDLAFLWIGVNDVLQKLRWHYRLLARLRGQHRSKTASAFRENYRAALDLLAGKANRVVAASPMILGEDVDNRWNRELAHLSEIIAIETRDRKNVSFVDLHLAFAARLAPRPASGCLPDSLLQLIRDSRQLSTPEEADRISRERGLHYTLDGVHLNSAGAELVAGLFAEAIQAAKHRREKHAAA